MSTQEEESVPVPTSSRIATIEYTKPNIELHGFGTEIADTPVYFHVMKMEGSVFIWIGSGVEPSFEDLSLALSTRYDRLPLVTRFMGAHSEMTSSNLASRLSKKYGLAVYVSYNLPTDRVLLPTIEKRLQEEIKMFPEKFGIKV